MFLVGLVLVVLSAVPLGGALDLSRWGVTPDRERDRYDAACQGGDGNACNLLGALLIREGDVRGGRAALQRACDLGDRVICLFLAEEAAERRDRPGEPEATTRAAADACEGGERAACVELARRLVLGRGVRPDPARAERLARDACDGGSDAGCVLVATLVMFGLTAEPDVAGARRLLEGACDRGAGAACEFFAYFLAKGWGGPRDEARARALAESLCHRHGPRACLALARFEAHGVGGPRDPAAALERLFRACEIGQTPACGTAGWVLLGEGRATDAYPYFLRGCGGGSSESCVNAAFYAWYTREDEAAAAEFFQRACDPGQPTQCLAGAVHVGGALRERTSPTELRTADAFCRLQQGAAHGALLARWWAQEGDAAKEREYRALARQAYDEDCPRDPAACRERVWLLGPDEAADPE